MNEVYIALVSIIIGYALSSLSTFSAMRYYRAMLKNAITVGDELKELNQYYLVALQQLNPLGFERKPLTTQRRDDETEADIASQYMGQQ